MENKFHIWQNAWKDGYDEPLEISLPESWSVEYHPINADSWPKLSKEQIYKKIRSPIASTSIQELAKSGHEAVIVFDDLSRGTPVKEIAEIVLEELFTGGIRKDHIRFICALGTHGAHTRADFVRKLGEEIVENYLVFNHNCFYNVVEIGKDKAGNPVEINAEFMSCDVRIGIGNVAPHPCNGYGGGGKLLFPGLASIKTTESNHSRREFNKIGSQSTCGLREDIENMTQMVGQFFKIDTIINSHLDVVDLFAGDSIHTYREAVKTSSIAHAMEMGEPKDVIIVNANAKYNESFNAMKVANMELKPGGDLILVNFCPCGSVVHYLYSPFGLNSGGPLWYQYSNQPRIGFDRLIYYSPFPDPYTARMLKEFDRVVFAKKWDEVLALLSDHGKDTKASIISDGTIGYFPSALKTR